MSRTRRFMLAITLGLATLSTTGLLVHAPSHASHVVADDHWCC